MLLHVITKKGLGYDPAMRNPVWFHACPSFVRESGEPAKKAARPSYTAIAIDSLVKLARQDSRIVAITAAMCEGTGLNAFEKEFPDRLYDVGIAEQHAVTFAAGLAVAWHAARRDACIRRFSNARTTKSSTMWPPRTFP